MLRGWRGSEVRTEGMLLHSTYSIYRYRALPKGAEGQSCYLLSIEHPSMPAARRGPQLTPPAVTRHLINDSLLL